MAKNKINIWWLILLLGVSDVYAKTLIPLTGKEKYISFAQIKKVYPELDLRLDRLTGVGIIKGKKGSLRFRIGGSFYTHGLEIVKISHPVIYKKQNLYLPPDVVEGVFLGLLDEDISYHFGDKYLALKKGGQVAGKNIALKYIIIDAGHGGKDPGTSNTKGTLEKEVTLKLALVLERIIKKNYPNVKTILTRDGDRFISLEGRAKIANKVVSRRQDAVYISLHCNSTLSSEPHGYEIYFFSQTASTEKARELALIENNIVDEKDAVGKIEADMLSSVIQRQGKILAEEVDRYFAKNLSRYIKRRGVKKADFAVLRGSLMPAILIETGYLSNKNDSLYLMNEGVMKIISKSIVQGIKSYVRKTK